MTESSHPSRRTGSMIGMIAFGLLFLAAVLIYGTAYFGFTTGEEFSPFTFKRRKFSYYELPLVGVQVSPVKREEGTGLVGDYVAATHLQIESEDRWDLVKALRGGQPAGFGEAEILCNYLDASDGNIWLDWSNENPELARKLWPVVIKLARAHLYIFVPELFHLAKEAESADELDTRLNAYLAAEFLQLARNQQNLSNLKEAVDLYTDALNYGPDEQLALEGRAAAYDALGETELAAADRARLQTSKP